MEINTAEIVLCEFYFSDLKKSKNRPVLVFKDNLPHNDFIAIPISSKVARLYDDECILHNTDFSDGSIPRTSKLIIRKTFVVSKDVILKKYGRLSTESYLKFHNAFCNYFGCEK